MTTLSDSDVLSAVAEPEVGERSAEGQFTLDTPITTRDGREWKTISLREPCVFHCLQAAKVIGKKPSLESVYDSQIDMVIRISGWPKAAVDQLGSTILDSAVAYVSAFEDDARRAPAADPDCPPSLVLVLSPAIEAVNTTFTDMTLREPVVAERRRFKATEGRGSVADFLQAEIDLVGEVSGWPLAAVLKMPISRFAQAADYLTGFFTNGRRTGNLFQQT
ncbi:MAG: phage tail assembly protein [Acetobacter sp.]|uniref:phage tail assembly protein n=1 Tax=Acetobacter sp. TaxID=440 RepID=UPI0039E858D2